MIMVFHHEYMAEETGCKKSYCQQVSVFPSKKITSSEQDKYRDNTGQNHQIMAAAYFFEKPFFFLGVFVRFHFA